MVVTVKYISDETKYNFKRIGDITNPENVIYINCYNNKLTLLPENMNFPSLQIFHCYDNKLVSLPENMNFPLLQVFNCDSNKLTSLPENINFPNLREFNCDSNKLTSLPENMDKMFPQLQKFYCGDNNLTSLPENMNFPLLQEFRCSNNQLVSLPENMFFPLLQEFGCGFNKLTSLPKNMDKMFPQLQKFYCRDNQLTSLPENMNFPQLEYFNCDVNELTSLPENMNFPALTHFNCDANELTSLPENMNLPQLQLFNCMYNQLSSLPENMNFPLLREFYCNNNLLTSLPENMNFPLLREFYCNNNLLTSLSENMNFPQLTHFYCDNNNLTLLPVCIMNWRYLCSINYAGNEIELSPQLERFLNRIHQGTVNKINVYDDTQNVHNSAIQGSVRDSINRLTTRRDLPKFDSETLNTMILSDDVLLPTVKQQLIEYCQDDTVHSLLLLKFSEVLWYVLNTISHDFSNDVSVQTEIKRVLNQEIQDAECKCFTGRMNRVVNCLNGFSPLVKVKISDGEQIGNVIIMLKQKALDTEGNYSVEKHKQLVERELNERGYDSETAKQWQEYIE